MQLPRLYKPTKTGATQVCDISTNGAVVTVSFGQLDGKMQQKTTTCKGKNIGKSNETTPEQQAELEAQSKWNKKVKSGYSTTISDAPSVQLPQKVKSYIGNESKIQFPAFSTYKLNGVNATYWLQNDGSLKLTSRGGETYPTIPHLENHIKYLMSVLETDCLNGELYIHGEHLQDISSAVKKPKELSKKLSFNIFEMPNMDLDFKAKAIWLNILGRTYEEAIKTDPGMDPYSSSYYRDNKITCIVPKQVNNKEELEAHYKEAMSLGYEGTVIYNANAVYKFNQRSSDVYKYKKTLDAEFQVVGYEFDKNDHVVYTCKSGNETGTTFKVKRKGTNDERLKDAQEAEQNLDKWLTIEYETLSKDGIPLKPVGVNFRACNTQGEPLE